MKKIIKPAEIYFLEEKYKLNFILWLQSQNGVPCRLHRKKTIGHETLRKLKENKHKLNCYVQKQKLSKIPVHCLERIIIDNDLIKKPTHRKFLNFAERSLEMYSSVQYIRAYELPVTDDDYELLKDYYLTIPGRYKVYIAQPDFHGFNLRTVYDFEGRYFALRNYKE